MKVFGLLGIGLLAVNCSAPVAPVTKELKNGGFTKEQAQQKPENQEPKENAEQKAEQPVATAPTDPNIMNLEEAKAKCAACHQPGGGDGANVWSTANGSEEDWKSFAMAARAAVQANRMPPPSGLTEPDKTRLISYLSQLLGESTGAATPTPAPTPVSYTFDTAKALCVGCHGRGQRSPRLTSTNDWRNNKSEIREAVRDGSMPKGKTLTEAERQALLSFIRSF